MAEVRPGKEIEMEEKGGSDMNHIRRDEGLSWENITFEVKNKRKILKGISGASKSFTVSGSF